MSTQTPTFKSRIEKKKERLNDRLAEVTKKIAALQQEKERIEKELTAIDNAAVNAFVKQQGIEIDDDFLKALALAQSLKKNGISDDDVKQLFDIADEEKPTNREVITDESI